MFCQFSACKTRRLFSFTQKNSVQKPSIPKGTRDFGPEESSKRKYIIDAIQKVYQKYGFRSIETPSMENLSVLMGKYGDEGDQLLFKVLNSGDFLKKTTAEDYGNGSSEMLTKISEKGLRYDLTVPFARYVVMNQHNITFPFKRYQVQPVWRADRPQKGRYREFYQCDADIIGTKSKWCEVELTLLIHDVFSALRLKDFALKVNHRGVLFDMAAVAGMKGKEIEFCVILDKLDKIGFDQVLKEINEKGGDQNVVADLLSIIDSHETDRRKLELLSSKVGKSEAFTELLDYLDTLDQMTDYDFQVDLDFSLARGLTYYTGIIYEVKPTSVKMGSICGGGRYDNLTGVFGMPDVSGIGISFGIDRIYDVLTDLNLFPEASTSSTQVLLTHFDKDSFNHGLTMLITLRKAGIASEIYPDLSKLKKQLGYANKLNIPYTITIGDNEMTSEKYPLKNMGNGKQESMTLKEIIAKLTSAD
ncbi:MAG: histidine--tRNA ligase [Cyclobacteriaceae bacterium]